MMMMSNVATPAISPVDVAAHRLLEAKRAEEQAHFARIAAEEALIRIVGVKEEGSFSTKTDFYKITTTGKLTRTLDARAWESIKAAIPDAIRDRIVDYKPQIVIKELRYVESNEPEVYKIFSQALEVKPAKAAVSVELI